MTRCAVRPRRPDSRPVGQDGRVSIGDPTGPATARRGVVPHGAGFWIVFAAFIAQMAFSTVPTPLYALYQQRDGFPTVTVTVIFALYAVGVLASLFFAGHISDWVGRRRMVLASLLVSLLAAGLFLTWNDVAGLMVARFVNGVAIGMLTAAATAHLSELGAAAQRSAGRSAVVSTLANLGGLGLGPLIAGALATYAPAPLTVPYAVFAAVFVILAVLVTLVPETVAPPDAEVVYRPQRIAVPAGARGRYWAAGAVAFAAFSVFGMFTALAPTFLAGSLHETSRLLAGFAPFVVFTAAALAQVFTGSLAMPVQVRAAVGLTVAGLAGVAVGAALASLWLFLLGGLIAGAGAGIGFRAAMGTAAALADPRRRGEALAGMFLIAYVGLTIPVVLIGAALLLWAQTPVLIVFAVVAAVLTVVFGVRMLRR